MLNSVSQLQWIKYLTGITFDETTKPTEAPPQGFWFTYVLIETNRDCKLIPSN